MEDEFIEYVQKRVRNLQKRKSKLEGYEAIRKEDPSKLNSDQINALANMELVNGPLKELQEILRLYSESKQAQKAVFEAKVAEEVKAAEQRGREESRATLRLFSVFLRTAAVKHQTETPAEELAAIDQLLQQLYLGDESSLESIDKLAAKSDEVVHGTWTYAQVHDLTSTPESQEPEPEQTEEHQPDEKISFLQEDELEVEAVAAVEPVAEAKPAAEAVAEPAAEPAAKETKKPQDRKRRKKPVKPTAAPAAAPADEGWEQAGRRQNDKKRKPRKPSA